MVPEPGDVSRLNYTRLALVTTPPPRSQDFRDLEKSLSPCDPDYFRSDRRPSGRGNNLAWFVRKLDEKSIRPFFESLSSLSFMIRMIREDCRGNGVYRSLKAYSATGRTPANYKSPARLLRERTREGEREMRLYNNILLKL